MILGIFLLLLLNGCSLFRQYGSIEGYVYVPDTGNKGAIIIRDSNQVPTGYKPLPGAKVSVQDFYNFVFTDINGYFLLEDVITGLVSLIIEPPINSGYNSLTTQVMVEPDTTVPVGTYGAVSLPSEGVDHWNVIINQIDYSEYPKVKVYVQILDPIKNTPMVGVKSDNFIIEINGNKVDTLSVTQAPGTTSYPASTSLVIDRSGSMEGEYGDDQPLIDAKEAAITFVNLMGINDRAEIISFGDNATIEQSFTNNKQALITAIEGISVHGWTALYDGIWQGLDDTATEANPRKAVIALTDGGENWSSSIHGGGDPPDNSLLIAHAQSLNVTVYTIGLAGYDFTREKVVRSYTTSEADLQEIAEETGGEYFYAPTSADLEHIYVEITQRVEQQYIITFTDNTGITDGILTVRVNYNQISGEDSKDYEPSEETLSAAGLAKKIVGADYLWGGKGWSIDYKAFLEPEQIKMEKYHYWYWDEDEEITKIGYGKGLDCSGLSFWSYNKAYGAIEYLSKDNPVQYENADGQYRYNFEESITEENLKPGDLLFFDHNNDGYKDHVAMYVGSDGSSYDVVNAFSPSVGIIWSKKEDLMALEGFVGFRRLTAPRVDIEFHGGPHIDLIITDPEGLTITKDIYEIPGAFYYYVYDIDGDGEFDDTIIVPEKKIGNYLIKVVPEPGALPTDTYSLEVIANGETIVLAENVPISDVPDRPCIIRSTETTIRVIEKP